MTHIDFQVGKSYFQTERHPCILINQYECCFNIYSLKINGPLIKSEIDRFGLSIAGLKRGQIDWMYKFERGWHHRYEGGEALCIPLLGSVTMLSFEHRYQWPLEVMERYLRKIKYTTAIDRWSETGFRAYHEFIKSIEERMQKKRWFTQGWDYLTYSPARQYLPSSIIFRDRNYFKNGIRCSYEDLEPPKIEIPTPKSIIQIIEAPRIIRYRSPIDMNQPTNLYRLFDVYGLLLYVGISFNEMTRVKAHMKKEWGSQIKEVTVEEYPTRGLAIIAERNAIWYENPLHNIVHNRSTHRRLVCNA